ncbi:hypothetical protein A2716_04595 [candidate division WWE3 bacterium RIFCSPHIGHO2_01_FULL_40_23]|uniref:Adenylate kinase n=1 Tax=candidate division WWE3 bacterium RIFCSPLOWO2_01_FULL_41_18 TaxID=1802625 RepID=A0A1F4VDX2_UNCKA|nr:MAG: hypothetical protein A2716_04595 [candidate division WWE3 bacterium RIFCSPHIGHO2_01_FULL_40_23]OGC55150.1 MAG: hypothetical protein A3A78_04205 [candidate division WWE3 bacterium RIFCSPLOWO2_01_FULL_41_18]
MHILVSGPQGSGKSTQAKLIAKKLNLNFLDSGAMLRESSETEMGMKAKEYMDRGEYVPEEIYFQIIKEYVKNRCDANKGFVFTGFPRTVDQIPFMEEELNIKLDKVFNLIVSPDEYMKRIQKRVDLEHRSDEAPEAVLKRLSEHDLKTGPVIEYFKAKGIVEDVDGERSIEEIFLDIMNRLKEVK